MQFPLYCLNLATSNALFSYIHTNTFNKDNILKSYYYKASIFKYITSFIVDTKPSSSFWNRRFIIFIIAFTFIFVFILFLLCKDKTVKLISLMKWIHQWLEFLVVLLSLSPLKKYAAHFPLWLTKMISY